MISNRSTPGEDQAGHQIAGETGTHPREIHVEHHHDEQEQHGNRADVDDDQQEGEELGPDQQEQAGRVEESQDQPQHAVHRVSRHDRHHA
jgi:hypothetical protein